MSTNTTKSTTQPAVKESKMNASKMYLTIDVEGKVLGEFKTKAKAVDEYERDKAVDAVLSPTGRVVHGNAKATLATAEEKVTTKPKAEPKTARVTKRGQHCPACGSLLVNDVPLPEEGGWGTRSCPNGHYQKRYPIVDMARFDLGMDYTGEYVPVFGGGAATARAVVEAKAAGMSDEDVISQFNKDVYLARLKAEREEARVAAQTAAREAREAARAAKKAEREAEKQAERDAKAQAKAAKAEEKAAEKAAKNA